MKYQAAAKLLEGSRSRKEIASFFLSPLHHPEIVLDVLIKKREAGLKAGADPTATADQELAGARGLATRASTFGLVLRGIGLLLIITFISCAVAPNRALSSRFEAKPETPAAADQAFNPAGPLQPPDPAATPIESMDDTVQTALDSAWRLLSGSPLPAPVADSFAGRLIDGRWTGVFMLDDQGELRAVARPETMPAVDGWLSRYRQLEDENRSLRESMESLARSEDVERIYLEINLGKNRLYVKMASQVLYVFPVVTGRGFTPREADDLNNFHTPRGILKVIEKEVNPVWYPPPWHWAEIGQEAPASLTPIAGVLGSRRLKLPNGFGIHGTQSGRIKAGKFSHGCIRMNKEDIELVFDLCDIGTEVYIY